MLDPPAHNDNSGSVILGPVTSAWKAALSLDRPRLWWPVAFVMILLVPAVLEAVETVGWTFAAAFTLWVATCLTSRVPPRVYGGAGGYRTRLGGWTLPARHARELPASGDGKRGLRGTGPFSGFAAVDDGATRPSDHAPADPAQTFRRAIRDWVVRRLAFVGLPAVVTVLFFGAFGVGPWLLLGWLAALVAIELAFYGLRWRRFAIVELEGGALRLTPLFVDIESIAVELHPRDVQLRPRRRSLFDSIGVVQLDDQPQLELVVRGQRFVTAGDVARPLLEWAQREAPAPYR